MTTTVLVLSGGPDAEREVSLRSGAAIAEALDRSGRYRALPRVIDRPSLDELRAMPGDAVWPALHGRWGEGGPLQRMLEQLGRPFVGCGSRAARLAMDKMATKSFAASLGIPTAFAAVLDPADDACPFDLPVVVKPIFEGSTIGLYVCRTPDQWRHAWSESVRSGKPCMVERFVKGRELTLGLVERAGRLTPLPVIEIVPAEGLYDYEAKYTRNDTRYLVDPPLDRKLTEQMGEQVLRLAQAMGIRHLCRADFILDETGGGPGPVAWFLEVNTMPGFTDHSLVPKASAHAGVPMPALCAALVDAAVA
ncbi:MAG: D-alanine--D-alanine ligase [Phycisphaerales bacterium]|nr:D-alanine--D-alanine ligase [Phycisphaerales bacterium]